MKTKIIFFAVLIFLIFGVNFAVRSADNPLVVTCDTVSSPQKVIIDGLAHPCGSGRNYCNTEKAILGTPECCASDGLYTDCVSAGPTPVPLM